jgi:hypothetical protein
MNIFIQVDEAIPSLSVTCALWRVCHSPGRRCPPAIELIAVSSVTVRTASASAAVGGCKNFDLNAGELTSSLMGLHLMVRC